MHRADAAEGEPALLHQPVGRMELDRGGEPRRRGHEQPDEGTTVEEEHHRGGRGIRRGTIEQLLVIDRACADRDGRRGVRGRKTQAEAVGADRCGEGLQRKLKLALMQAYQTEGKNPGDHSLLLQLVADVGLDKAEASAILQSDAFAAEGHLKHVNISF